MEKGSRSRFLTLKNLSKRADTLPANTTEDWSRRTVDWARTFLVQASLFAGMAGLRLPTPHVGESHLVWNVGTALIRVTFYQPPPDGLKTGKEDEPVDPQEFLILGDVTSPAHITINDRRIYAQFELNGRFTPQFVFSSLLDWFTMPTRKRNDPRLEFFLNPVDPWKENLGPEEELGIWISPEESGDIHEIVREAFVSLDSEGHRMEFAGLTFDQMARLRDDWDGRGAARPSKESLEWAKVALENLTQAADATGIGFRRPLTQIFSAVPAALGPPEVYIAIRCLLWSNLLVIYLRTTPNEYKAWVSLEFEEPTDESSPGGWLTIEFGVFREPGKSQADTLREF